MEINEFIEFHTEKAKTLSVFEVLQPDSAVDKEVVERVEKELDCSLPRKYVDFCLVFGGGYFGFTVILSMDTTGDWYIIDKIQEFNYCLPSGFVPFSDDQSGGFYCFKVEKKVALDSIFYIDSSGSISKTGYIDFLDYLINKAYS